MTGKVALALVFHNHQPVGNFGWVFEDVYQRAYEPMIGALERHPHVRLGLHYTGPLLEWMLAKHPEAIVRLRTLVERGQVEILGGALYEPILVTLPMRDRLAQLVRMRAEVERLFGAEPAGAWLAERVWEPSLPFDLVEAGYRYTILDDNHLRAAAIRDEDMWGTYTTDDQGRMLTIFGTEKGLRYLIPWRPADELFDYLRDAAQAGGPEGRRVGMMGDDGEKFGSWPGTHELSWGRDGWVEKCFTGLAEHADWLTTVTPSEWMATNAPVGRAYFPTASYVEMTEWVLPPEQARAFHRALDREARRPSNAAPFLRGGMWRNYQARYREVNDLHKQMLRTSQAVDAMLPGPVRDRAMDHLHRGQSNDVYWHGLFGGIYIVHMRLAVLAELIAAEDLAAGEAAVAGIADYDLDGIDEVLLGTRGQTVLIDLAEGAGIGSWDLRASRVALASVMRRRPEAYHENLRKVEASSTRDEELKLRERELARALVYDDYERRSGLVRVLDRDGNEVGDFVSGPWMARDVGFSALVAARAAEGVAVTKSVELSGGKLDPRLAIGLTIAAAAEFSGTLELEMNVVLSGGGGNPAAYYRWANHEARHDSGGSILPGSNLAFGNEHDGVDIAAHAEPGAEASWSSIDTVSNSEAGFERIHQGSCLVFRWPLALQPGEERSFQVSFTVTETRDRAAEENGGLL